VKRSITLVALLATGLAAADFAGKWTGQMKAGGPTGPALFLTLRQKGNVVSGEIAFASEAHPVPLQDAALHGNSLTFHATDNFHRAVYFDLTLSGSGLRGDATMEGHTFKVALALPVAPGVYRVGGGVTAPRLLYKSEPQYTEEARQAKVQGTVRLKALVNPEGNATGIRVLQSLGLGLDEAAVRCVKDWKFKPGTKDGQAVTVEVEMEINFRLK